MEKKKKLSVFEFFRNVIQSQSLFVLMCTVFASLFWGVDTNIRSFIMKSITDQLEDANRQNIIVRLIPYISLFVGSLLFRFVVLRVASYIRNVHLMPNYKLYIIDYFVSHFMNNSDVTDQKALGSYSNKIQELVKFFEDFFHLIFIDIICHFIALIFVMVSFYYISFSCFMCLMMLILFFVTVALFAYKTQSSLSSKEIKSNIRIFSEFNDIMLNIFHIKTLNSQNFEEERFDEFCYTYKKDMQNRSIYDFFILSSLSFIFILYHSLCLIFLLWQFQGGTILHGYIISRGEIVYIIMLNITVPEYLWNLVEDIASTAKLFGKSKSLINDLILVPQVTFKSIEFKSKLNSYDICFDNVTFNYTENKTLFRNLSLTIESNTKVGIIGYSGSGKSSIISLLLRLRDPDSGVIYIDGKNIIDFSSKTLTDLMTVMTQDVSLLNRTIAENISYGNKNASMAEIEEVARLANISEFIEQLPFRYDELVTSNGKEFSYGQRQRLLIARAFLRDSPILLLDEMTASLDNKSEEIVLTSLNKLMENRTVIVIAHKLYTLKNMDKLIMLDNGKLVCQGTHKELMKNSHYLDLLNYA